MAEDLPAASLGCRKIKTFKPNCKGSGVGTTLLMQLLQYKRTNFPHSGHSAFAATLAAWLNFKLFRKDNAAVAASQDMRPMEATCELPSTRGGSDDRVVLGSGCMGINMAMPYPCHAFRVLRSNMWSVRALFPSSDFSLKNVLALPV